MGSGVNHRVSGQRLLQLPYWRSDFGVESAPMTEQGPPNSRRDELLDLAATMFAERGLRATTVRDIADSAGILSGSLYHHFSSKEAMVDEILRGFLDDLFSRYREIVASGLSARDTLDALVLASYESFDQWHAAVAIYQ